MAQALAGVATQSVELLMSSFKRASSNGASKGGSTSTQVSVLLMLSTRRDAQGKIIGTVGVGQDIS